MPNPAFMLRCLDLASQGRGKVGNGALVGAVLVRDGKIIAEGYHRGFGDVHAERDLLENFKDSVKPDDVLYVNLEPCCHQGKTPPCTNILIERGVKHVVFGMRDPDSRVSGKGITTLLENKIDVIGAYYRAECEYLNKGFAQVRTMNRPWIILKSAKTKGGQTAKADGSPLKITSADQDAWSHTFLRSFHDAILVGIGTVISDNPLLNRRFDQTYKFSQIEGLNGIVEKSKKSFQPYRIVLDPQCRIDAGARMLSSEEVVRTIICCSPESLLRAKEKCAELRHRGAKIFGVPVEEGEFVWSELWKALLMPSQDFYGITSILVEGGRQTWEKFHRAGFVDEEVALIGSL